MNNKVLLLIALIFVQSVFGANQEEPDSLRIGLVVGLGLGIPILLSLMTFAKNYMIRVQYLIFECLFYFYNKTKKKREKENQH